MCVCVCVNACVHMCVICVICVCVCDVRRIWHWQGVEWLCTWNHHLMNYLFFGTKNGNFTAYLSAVIDSCRYYRALYRYNHTTRRKCWFISSIPCVIFTSIKRQYFLLYDLTAFCSRNLGSYNGLIVMKFDRPIVGKTSYHFVNRDH